MSAFLPSNGCRNLRNLFFGVWTAGVLWYFVIFLRFESEEFPHAGNSLRESQSFCSKSLVASCWYVGNCWRQPTDFEYAYFHDLAKTMEDLSTFSLSCTVRVVLGKVAVFWAKSWMLNAKVGIRSTVGVNVLNVLRHLRTLPVVDEQYFEWHSILQSCLWCSWTWANVDVADVGSGLDAMWLLRSAVAFHRLTQELPCVMRLGGGVINSGGILLKEWRVFSWVASVGIRTTFKPKPIQTNSPNKIRGNPGWWFREIPIYYTPFAHQFGGDIFLQVIKNANWTAGRRTRLSWKWVDFLCNLSLTAAMVEDNPAR